MATFSVEINGGELIDKLTILQIKLARITDPSKQANIRRELATITEAHAKTIDSSANLVELTRALRIVNESLWDIEDQIREHESRGDFGTEFIELARSVYIQNDERARLKRTLSMLLNSDFLEEKDYRPYTQSE